jgi:hypothetical protein
VRRASGTLERRRIAKDGKCEQEEVGKHRARVEREMVLFRTLYNCIERESNGRESYPPHHCHSAALDWRSVTICCSCGCRCWTM